MSLTEDLPKDAGKLRRRFYGRRRGRALRPGRQRLLAQLRAEGAIILPPDGKLAPSMLFPNAPAALWLEIGFGAGEHLATQAAAHPEIGFLGAEVYENGIAKLAAEIARRQLGNIRLFCDDARLLLAALPDACLERVFILFPDPWPKERHKKRRIVSTETLDALARLMVAGGELRLATDDMDYARAMLACAIAHPAFCWLARRAQDWRQRSEDWPATRYEQKAVAAGRQPIFLRFRRRP